MRPAAATWTSEVLHGANGRGRAACLRNGPAPAFACPVRSAWLVAALVLHRGGSCRAAAASCSAWRSGSARLWPCADLLPVRPLCAAASSPSRSASLMSGRRPASRVAIARGCSACELSAVMRELREPMPMSSSSEKSNGWFLAMRIPLPGTRSTVERELGFRGRYRSSCTCSVAAMDERIRRVLAAAPVRRRSQRPAVAAAPGRAAGRAGRRRHRP